MDIPDDLESVIREIDEELKAEGVKPHQRSTHAIMKFGQRFKISIPITPVDPRAGAELYAANKYCAAIHDWYERVYANRMKVDFQAERSVAVVADGDIWEIKLPWLRGSANIIVSSELSEIQSGVKKGPVLINVTNHIVDITQARLDQFSREDLQEAANQFMSGMQVCDWLDRARKQNPLFVQASSDLSDSVRHLCAQSPNFGQSRWSSLMFVEKFMKAVILELGLGEPAYTHNLTKLRDKIREVAPKLDLSSLIADIQCSAETRYGRKLKSTREEAFAAHKASLEVVLRLKDIVTLSRAA